MTRFSICFYWLSSLMIVFSVGLSSCTSGSNSSPLTDYQLAVSESLSNQEKENGLVGGLHFGMTQATFFDYCKRQQKLGRMNDGADNMIRVYVDSSAIPGTTVLEFYPGFNENGEINFLKGRIYSLQWAPWSPQYNALNLLDEGREYLIEQLGGAPFKQYESVKENTLVKLDANRRVLIYPHEFAQERLVFLVHNLDDSEEEVLKGVDVLPVTYPTLSSETNGH